MLRLRRKAKSKGIDEKRLNDVMKRELADYMKRDELRNCLNDIERDKRKRELWNSLPVRRKIRLLRYVLEKKGEQYGKK